MDAITYLLKRNIVNYIKEFKKRPLKIIIYLLFLVLLVFSIFSSTKVPRDMKNNNLDIYNSIFLALTLLLLFLSIKGGLEKGNSLFRLSDVNFLFPAPIKPQKVLIYGFIKQVYANFFFIIILSFQLPNLYINFPLKPYAGILIVGNTFLLSFFCSVISIFIYSIGSLKEDNKKIINYVLYGLTGLLFIGSLYYINKSGNILTGILNYFKLPFFKYIPIVGWFINIYNGAIYGFNSITLIYLVLTIIVTLLIIYLIYKLDLDYYEDALNTTISKEKQIAKAKSGNKGFNISNSKIKKTKAVFKHSGARAILSKQIIESKKTSSVFIDKITLISAATTLAVAYFGKFETIDSVLYMFTYMTLIFSQANKWTLELNNHYIYLIPESSIKKIIYATSLEIMESLVNGLIIFIVASFMYKVSVFQGIMVAFTYTSFSAIILYSDLVIRRMIGDKVNILVEKFLKFLITILLALPGIILAFTLGTQISEYTGIYGTYLIQIIYNVFASLLLIALSRGIFEKIEMK